MALSSSHSVRRSNPVTLHVESLEQRQLLTAINLSLAILPPSLPQPLASAPALSAGVQKPGSPVVDLPLANLAPSLSQALSTAAALSASVQNQVVPAIDLSLAIVPTLLPQALSNAPALSAVLQTQGLGGLTAGLDVSVSLASVSQPQLGGEAHGVLGVVNDLALGASVDVKSQVTAAPSPGADLNLQETSGVDLDLHSGISSAGGGLHQVTGVGFNTSVGVGLATADSAAVHEDVIAPTVLGDGSALDIHPAIDGNPADTQQTVKGNRVDTQQAIDAVFSTRLIGQDLPMFAAGHDGDRTNLVLPADTDRHGAGEGLGSQPEQSLDLADAFPQGNDLLTRCVPSESASLDRLLEQFLSELGSFSSELVGSLARLGLNPWIMLMLAGAAVAGEIARRQLRQSQGNPAIPLLTEGLL
jgi:hypothetical protein